VIIALDAMGGDLAPAEPVCGAVLASRDLGIDIALVGDAAALRVELERQGGAGLAIQIVNATEVIAMHEQPVQAVRQKKDASINVAMQLVKKGEASGVVSAGNTGAVMASGTLNLGRIAGIERPALGTIAPYTDTGILVLDVGANADCKPSYLVQFAQMGTVYAQNVLGIAQPRVGLLNIGEEETKGNELMQEVFALLRQTDLNFIGNIEPDRIPLGIADVVVTDGFTGNIAVKSTEGAAEFIFRQLRTVIASKMQYKLAALVLRPALLKMRQRMDYGEYGGAPLLGVNGVVLITHGRADANAIKNSLRAARESANSGLLEKLRGSFSRGERAIVAPSSALTEPRPAL
jgi:glycerol-3-phosphate acyltransferase PlsX